MARIVRSLEAQNDVLDIALHISEHNLTAALAWVDEVDERLHLLAEMPGAGRERPEFGDQLRSFPVGDYLIIYRALNDGIEVARVLHGARNLRRLFGKD